MHNVCASHVYVAIGKVVAPVFPAYIRHTQPGVTSCWQRSCPVCPLKRGASPVGAWVVLESVRGKDSGVTVNAPENSPAQGAACRRAAAPSAGVPVTHYRPFPNDLAIRFPAPYAMLKRSSPRVIRARGSYELLGIQCYACFKSVPLSTCV